MVVCKWNNSKMYELHLPPHSCFTDNVRDTGMRPRSGTNGLAEEMPAMVSSHLIDVDNSKVSCAYGSRVLRSTKAKRRALGPRSHQHGWSRATPSTNDQRLLHLQLERLWTRFCRKGLAGRRLLGCLVHCGRLIGGPGPQAKMMSSVKTSISLLNRRTQFETCQDDCFLHVAQRSLNRPPWI